MQLLASMPNHGDQVGGFQQSQMLGDPLPGHIQIFTQLTQGLAIAFVQLVQQFPPIFIRQRFEYYIHGWEHATNWLHMQEENYKKRRQASQRSALFASDRARVVTGPPFVIDVELLTR